MIQSRLVLSYPYFGEVSKMRNMISNRLVTRVGDPARAMSLVSPPWKSIRLSVVHRPSVGPLDENDICASLGDDPKHKEEYHPNPFLCTVEDGQQMWP